MRTDVRLMICVYWRGDASLAETMGRAPRGPLRQRRPAIVRATVDQPCVGAVRRFLASGVSSDRNMPTMFKSLVASTGLTR